MDATQLKDFATQYIAASKGHFDEADYQRQLNAETGAR